MLRHTIWQIGTQTAPRKWPLPMSLLLLLTLCVAGWALVGGALHMVYNFVS